MKQTEKLAMTYFALCAVMAETMDGLKESTIYRKNIVRLSKQLMFNIEKENNFIHKHLDAETEPHYHRCCEMAENFVTAIKTKDITIMYMLMQELVNGDIRVVEDDKHRKMMNQLESI